MARTNRIPRRPDMGWILMAGLLGAGCIAVMLLKPGTWWPLGGVLFCASTAAIELQRWRWWNQHRELAAASDVFYRAVRAMSPELTYVARKDEQVFALRVMIAERHPYLIRFPWPKSATDSVISDVFSPSRTHPVLHRVIPLRLAPDPDGVVQVRPDVPLERTNRPSRWQRFRRHREMADSGLIYANTEDLIGLVAEIRGAHVNPAERRGR